MIVKICGVTTLDDALMAALPKLRGRTDAAEYLKKLREAALAEDTGEKLQEELRKLAEA